MHIMINIDNCNSLITYYNDHKIIDFLGGGVKSIPNDVVLPMIKDAYTFVVRAENEFLKARNEKLSYYYKQLREYFEFRLPIWG